MASLATSADAKGMLKEYNQQGYRGASVVEGNGRFRIALCSFADKAVLLGSSIAACIAAGIVGFEIGKEIGEWIKYDEKGQLKIKAYFEPIPKRAKTIDYINAEKKTLAAEDFKQYKTIVIPEVQLVSLNLKDMLENFVKEGGQLLILGTGEAHFEQFFQGLAREFPDRVAAKITFNLGLAARIYAGGDIYLMPSKSEPCGLSQMNAMRYGTVPVVHATGGLKDTVPPADENGEGGLGFTFQSYNADDFYASVKRCLNLYNENREGFNALVKTDMSQDFSWNVPAGRYMELFQHMCSW